VFHQLNSQLIQALPMHEGFKVETLTNFKPTKTLMIVARDAGKLTFTYHSKTIELEVEKGECFVVDRNCKSITSEMECWVA